MDSREPEASCGKMWHTRAEDGNASSGSSAVGGGHGCTIGKEDSDRISSWKRVGERAGDLNVVASTSGVSYEGIGRW